MLHCLLLRMESKMAFHNSLGRLLDIGGIDMRHAMAAHYLSSNYIVTIRHKC